MRTTEQISGDKLKQIILWLINEKSPVTMRDTKSQKSTTIFLQTYHYQNGKPYFLINYLNENDDLVDNPPPVGSLMFEFYGEDGILHQFKTEHFLFVGTATWVKSPTTIKRIQKRKSFRIDTPEKTLIIIHDGERTDLTVINLSVGGALVSVKEDALSLKHQALFDVEYAFENAVLEILYKDDIFEITFPRIQIVRKERRPTTGLIFFGLQFMDLNAVTESRLSRIVLDIQRGYIQSRLKIK